MTVRIQHPFGRIVLLGTVLAIMIMGTAEAVFRTPALARFWPAASVGIPEQGLDISLNRLRDFADEGPVECIILGSSLAFHGIQPRLMTAAIDTATGVTLRCFLVGANGLTTSGAVVIAEYLIDAYDPALLIYGFSPRDLTVTAVNKGVSAATLNDVTWINYRQGEFTVTGWLIDHSAAFREYTTFSKWMTWGYDRWLEDRHHYQVEITENDGFRPWNGVLELPLSTSEAARMSSLFADITYDPVEFAALDNLIALHDPPRTTLLLVEIPVHRLVIEDFMTRPAYDAFVAEVQTRADARDVLFWPTTREYMIPADEWNDPNHLNAAGAARFSTWLGEHIGQSISGGELPLLVPKE